MSKHIKSEHPVDFAVSDTASGKVQLLFPLDFKWTREENKIQVSDMCCQRYAQEWKIPLI